MSYYWMYYNTSSGTIAPQHSTHPPVVAGCIDPSMIPEGNAVLGVYDDSGDNPMPSDFATAFYEPQAWLYQNASFLPNPNYETSAFSQAQQQQLAILEQDMQTTLKSGFTSKLTGHQYPTDSNAQSNFTAGVTAFTTNPNKTSITVLTLDAGWVSHTKDQFFGMYNDGDSWKEAQYPQLTQLQGKVNALQLSNYASLDDAVAAVKAIVWIEATY